MAQYVYTMNRVGKVVPPKREILKDISLSFFPGAKIGVLGLNGAGKSTLLRIMAGLDTEIDGEARPMPDIKVGYLPQEPELDASETVRESVETAVDEVNAVKQRLDEVYAAYAEPDADFDALAAEQAKLEAMLQTSGGHDLERQLEIAADALRLPPWDAVIGNLSGGEKRRAKQESSHAKSMKAELEWVRQGAKGRQSKSKARLARFAELQSREFQKRSETNEIYIPTGQRLGEKVIDFNGVSKGFGDRLLIDNLSFSVPQGAIVGVIGGNGAGKSTLFRMIMGTEQPDAGTIEIGETVDLAWVDQSRDALDGDKTVWELVSDGLDLVTIGSFEMPSRAYIGRFNFKGADQQKLVRDLSGGERGRLQLAMTLKQGANVLLLDEPSNDLDVETLRALEEALLDFPGAAIVISHDRWFLDRVATHILAYEDDSHVEFFAGNYTEYEADRKRRLGDDAAQPRRVKYKRLA